MHQNRHLLFNRSNSKVTLALLCTFIEIITQYVLCLFAIIAKIKSVPLVCIWDFWCNSAHPEQRRKNFKNHKIFFFCYLVNFLLFLTCILLELYFVCIWLQYWYDISFFRNSNICCFGWAEWHIFFAKKLLIFYSPSPLGGDIFAAILQQQAIIPQQHIKGRKIQ